MVNQSFQLYLTRRLKLWVKMQLLSFWNASPRIDAIKPLIKHINRSVNQKSENYIEATLSNWKMNQENEFI